MADFNILDRYGIKEVADVTFYKIDANGNPTTPVLYLDTLKVSTIEQTAENTSARGGKGNPELIMWDYGKEITVTLEDALFSAKSMAIMYGAVDTDGDAVLNDTGLKIRKTVRKAQVVSGKVVINGNEVTIPTTAAYYKADGSEGSASDYDYVTFELDVVGSEIVISSDKFPGTYYVTGDTYARSETTGQDEFFQFILPKAKITSEVTLTMEAEGDPSTFSMNLKVLRPANGEMMKLVKYSLPTSAT
jgi:hypothetical protein